MAHRVPFLVAELGADVEPFLLHLYAALAEKERAVISLTDGDFLDRQGTHPDLGRPVITDQRILSTIGSSSTGTLSFPPRLSTNSIA
jgi:hypothetical protein